MSNKITLEKIETACDDLKNQMIHLMNNRDDDEYIDTKLVLGDIERMIDDLMDEEDE